MNCAISQTQQKRFGTQVARDLIAALNTDEPFDLKAYMKTVYDQVKTATNDHARAIDYTRLVPIFIEQITAFDREIKGGLLRKGFDFNTLAALAFDVQDDTTGVALVESTIEVTEPNVIIDELNTLNGITETPGETSTEETDPQPAPVPPLNPPATRGLAQRIVSAIKGFFLGAAPTAMVDRVVEAVSFKKNEPGYNVPDPDQKFYFDVKRNILKVLGAADYDSSQMDYEGFGPVFLTAMSIAQIKDIDLRPGELEDITQYDPEKKGVVLVLTNQFGEPLRFNTQGKPTLEENGRIAYYKLRSTEGVFNEDGSVNLKRADEKSISNLAKLNNISQAAAKEIFIRELQLIDDMRKHISGTNKMIRSTINGGSLGSISIDISHRTRLSNVNLTDVKFKPDTVTQDGQVPGMMSGTSFFHLEDMHGEAVEIERPRIAEETDFTELIASLMTDELVDQNGRPIFYDLRKQYLENYIYKNDKRLQLSIKSDENGVKTIYVTVDGWSYALTSDASRAAAKEAVLRYLSTKRPTVQKTEKQLTDRQRKLAPNTPASEWKINDALPVVNEQGVHQTDRDGNKLYRIIDMAKLHVNKNQFGQNFSHVSIQKNEAGQNVLTTQNMAYNDFIIQNFFVHTELNAEKKIVRLDSYFTFQPLQEDVDKIYTREVVEEPARQAAANPPAQSDLTSSDPGGTQLTIDDMIRNNLGDDELLNKNIDQKNADVKATLEQIEAARLWYERHPLSEHFPFEAMFHLVNSQDPSSLATWGMHGIILYKGADYSDLYHEAWHAFTQSFMTREQKKALYEEARKKTGSFTDFKGYRVQFSNATDIQIEEYLAEGFRKYMLNGQKEEKGAPVKNNLFKKIWNFLKSLFENTSVTEIIDNDKANATIHDLYNKLRVGNLSGFNFSAENVQFTTLSKGMEAWNADEMHQALSYQQSEMIKRTVDALLAEYMDRRNSGLTDQELMEYGNLEQILRDPDQTLETKRDAKNKLESLKAKRTYKFTTSVLKSDTQLKLAYNHAYNRIAQLYQAKQSEFNAETNPAKKDLLEKQANALHWAFRNFGDLENIQRNFSDDITTVKGVIGYHRIKSDIYFDETTGLMIDDENMTETETFLMSRQGIDRKGNETSMKDLAAKEILYLLSTLSKVNKKGEVEYNELGVPDFVKFQEVWNRLARTLENTLKIEDMEQKMLLEAEKYPVFKQILNRMGPAITSSRAENRLWTSFWQTFNKANVPLIMLTLTQNTNPVDNKVTYTANVGQGFNERKALERRWDSYFKNLPPSKYIGRDIEGNYLNIDAVLNDFRVDNRASDDNKLAGREYEFFKAIGIKLTDDPEVREELKSKAIGAPSFRIVLQMLKVRGETIRSVNDITREYKTVVNGVRPDGLGGRMNKLTNLEVKYSDSVSNYMVTNAEGNTQFEQTLNNSLTVIANTVNSVKSYAELIAIPHMSHLDIARNPFMKSSTWLNSIFDLSKPDGPKRELNGIPVKLELTNIAGTVFSVDKKDVPDKGISSAGADEFTKAIMDLHLMIDGGRPELVRHADKSTSYSMVVSKIFRVSGSKLAGDDRQYILNRDFFSDAYETTMFEMLVPQVMAEATRIQKLRNLQKRKDDGENIGPFDYKYLREGQDFVQFHKVLSQETKQKLLLLADNVDTDFHSLIKNADSAELINTIQNEIRAYFDVRLTKAKKTFEKIDFMSTSTLNKIKGEGRNIGMTNISDAEAKNVLLKSYVINSWIHNLESVNFLYGDLALYNHMKEEFHKRNAGMGSTGNLYRTDKAFQNYANQNLGRKYAESQTIESKSYDGTFDTAVVADSEIGSVYYKEYLDAIGDSKAAKAYAEGEMKEGDAQGWITFDAYRLMKEAEGNWSTAQERLYQDIVAGKPIDASLVLHFFPAVKAQYMGPLKTAGLPITAFHKFSLFPLIPTVIEGTNLKNLHMKMMREGIDYALFQSGSKVGTLTKDEKTDLLYTDGKRTLSDTPFTKNTIFMEYLKNQLEIAPKYKKNVIFSTQLRKLIEDGLYEEGKALTEEFEKLVLEYEDNIRKLTEITKDELLKEAGWSRSFVDGKETVRGDMKDLMKFVRKELSRQDLADHEIDFLQVGHDGKIKRDLSLSPSADRIEKLVNAIVTKRLVKQKSKGEGLIQVSGAMFERVDSTQNRDYTNPSERDLLDYGSNDLPTYTRDYFKLKRGIEISSNSKGLGAALTNPTELAKSKNNLKNSYPVEVRGTIYDDAEAAYQALKGTATRDTGPNSTYALMVEIITAKLQQHPKLVREIKEHGGSAWILSSTHQPTNQNSVWETGGKNWFIKALNEAYSNISNIQLAYKALGLDVREYTKPWRDGSQTNQAWSFALSDKPKEIFELVKDKESGYWSVHFKTTGRNTLTDVEKQQLIEALVSKVPVGDKISTWGEVTPGGYAGLKRLLNAGFVETSEMRTVEDNTIPVYEKTNKSNVQQKIERILAHRSAHKKIITIDGVKTVSEPVNIGARFPKDQVKADYATKMIGFGAENTSTRKYAEKFGDKANTGSYDASDQVFISVNGKGRPGLENNINKTKNEIKKALSMGVNVFITDNSTTARSEHNAPGEGVIADFLKAQGLIYTEKNSVGFWIRDGVTAGVPQNKVSGVESYGSLTTANDAAIKQLGANPHSIDMIEAGFRTRTTRSHDEMSKYKVKVGDVIKHVGKSANGTTKTVYARVTAIHPKGTPGWKGTWEREGWRAEDVDVIDRFKDGAAAIEFELLDKPDKTRAMKVKVALQGDFLNLLNLKHIDGKTIDTRERLNEMLRNEKWLNIGNNRKMITMVGVRIPVQGLNSMEFMEVYEFLPIEAGNIIIPPAEIVAKAGADFDIDKLTVLMPNISKKVHKAKLTNELLRTLSERHSNLDFSRDNVNIILDGAKDDSGVYTLTDEDRQILQILEDEAEVEIIYETGDTKKGLQNALINNIRSILELPENFTSLIRPNGTDIVKTIADEDLEEHVQEYNPKNVEEGGTGKMISPTSIFEIEYNLYKHSRNAVGKASLGLGAVDNTYNSIFNRVGARLNPTAGITTERYNEIKQEALIKGEGDLQKGLLKLLPQVRNAYYSYHPQRLLMRHNSVDVNGEKAISLSKIKDAAGEHRISDVINQMINGWVDVAKDTWIFNIQGNKEISPILLFMIQAGIPVKEAIYFVSMPLVRQYVREQQLAKSTYAIPLDKDPGEQSFFRTKAREEMLTNPAYGFNFQVSERGISNNQVNSAALKQTRDVLGEGGQFNQNALYDIIKQYSLNQKSGNTHQHTAYERAAFLHFLEIEAMANAVRDVKLRMNFDTTKSATLFEAQNRILMKEELKEESRIPSELVDNIIENSPIGSFYIQPFQLAVWKKVFQIRNNSIVNDFIMEKLWKNNTVIRQKFSTPEIFANQFHNDLISFLFQNTIKRFDFDSNSYRGRRVESEIPPSVRQVIPVTSLQFGAFVKDGVLYVDKAQLRRDFLNKSFSNETYIKRGLAKVSSLAFSTPTEYYNFVYEREHLRSQISFESVVNTMEYQSLKENAQAFFKQGRNESAEDFDKRISKQAYESLLRDKALSNTYNYWHMFKSKNTYADEFNSIVADYPDLLKEFFLMNNITTSIKAGFRNLRMNDTFLEKGDINLFHENLRDLINGNIQSVKEPADRERIMNFFRRFPVVALLQSGLDTKTQVSLTRIIPYDLYTRIMEETGFDFKIHLELFENPQYAGETSALLEDFYQRFMSANTNRSTRTLGKNYLSEITIDIANKMLIEKTPLKEVLDIGPFYQPIQAIGAEIQGFDSLTITNQTDARALVQQSPDYTFVYNHALDNQSNATKGDHLLSAIGEPNVIGLPTLLAYTGGSAVEQIKDIDGQIDPRVKEAIDQAIENLIEHRNNGQKLVFNINGYGQSMIGATDTFIELLGPTTYQDAAGNTVRATMAQRMAAGEYEYERLKKTIRGTQLKEEMVSIRRQNPDLSYVIDQATGRPVMDQVIRYYAVKPGIGTDRPAPQTFLYLSKRLFEEFGYINNNYLNTKTGQVEVQSAQSITDEQVRDFMNHCK